MSQPQENSMSAPSISINKTLVRACESCRLRKLRCLQDASSSSPKCQRCANSNRECIFTDPSRKRRRVRTDTRVAELEKEIKAMNTVLKRGDFSINRTGNSDDIERVELRKDSRDINQSNPLFNASNEDESIIDHENMLPADFVADQTFENSADANRTSNKISENSEQFLVSQVPTGLGDTCYEANFQDTLQHLSLHNDVVDRGILSLNEATLLFSRYIDDLVQHFPAVVLPEGSTAGQIRRAKPTLFLAIMAAASGSSDPNLNNRLNQEILQVYADRIAIKGEKSLELIQSMLITIIWYFPPDNFEELKFYQYIHMAATMALDIGIGRKPKPPEHCNSFPNLDVKRNNSTNLNKTSNYSAQISDTSPNSGHIECRRTLLACYLKCSR